MVLPFESMAQIMRASLAASAFEVSTFDIIKVVLWCVGVYAVSIRIFNKK